ncbi:uncharacterized protein LOC135468930 [Liolophura sinensis]|uniref:uncharacterized protein LOC135468930 n=1 Tax=Liolophura sinensis TaxID=3198878 RepID=UPI0031597A08
MKSFLPVFVVLICYQLSGTDGRLLPRSQITIHSDDHFEYLPDIEDSILRMADLDNSGAISNDEIRVFLATPGVPEFLRNALTRDTVQGADTNRNGQLERYELQGILMDALSTFSSSLAVVKILSFETEQMINRGDITLPETSIEVAQTLLDALDSNNNNKLSLDEASEFYSLVFDQRFWESLVEASAALDADRDSELNLKEIVEVYEALGEKYDSMDMEPLIMYARIKSALGAFPEVEN